MNSSRDFLSQMTQDIFSKTAIIRLFFLFLGFLAFALLHTLMIWLFWIVYWGLVLVTLSWFIWFVLEILLIIDQDREYWDGLPLGQGIREVYQSWARRPNPVPLARLLSEAAVWLNNMIMARNKEGGP